LQPLDSPLQHYLQIIRRQATLLILVPVITVAAAYALLEIKDPKYRASMTLVVGEPRAKLNPVLGDVSLTRTMTTLIEGDYVARNTIESLDLNQTLKEFDKRLKVEVLPDTSVLKVTYEATDPQRALDVVGQIARIFDRRVSRTIGQKGDTAFIKPQGGSFDLIVRQFDPPHVDPDPIQPARGTTLILAGIAGLVLALMLAVARDSLDSRIRSRKDAEEWFGAKVVGALPKPRGWTPPLASSGAEESHAASLELLRARLQFTQGGIGGPTILVTSAAPDEGKSTVAASLSAALARAGKRVIVVDADLRRPTLPSYLSVETDGPGLVDVLHARVALEEALVSVDPIPVTASLDGSPADNGEVDTRRPGRLEVLPAGHVTSVAGDVLTPEALGVLIDRLHERADYIVIDAPPLLVADALGLALQADNVLLVARRGRTTRDQAEWARMTLEGLGVTKISVVPTNAPPVETYA
jgi:capsular polysaccharide biosynthesis protein/Mrp family chromosome partitioning ATPase